MERVTFLVEDSNERISCMLNPETVLIKRTAGVRTRESLSGILSTAGKGDNPLLFTGGGYTTLELDLVFDISIAGSSVVSSDVRDLTRPIWNLSENQQRHDGLYRPAVCRFIWGKSWNIPGVVSALSEKLESFSSEGVPRRSWMRLKLIRMQEQPQPEFSEKDLLSGLGNQKPQSLLDQLNNATTRSTATESPPAFFQETDLVTANTLERIDLAADRINGDSSSWRDISIEFNLENPLQWLEREIQQITSVNDSRTGDEQ